MHVLLDSASLYYRSYYALPESMTAPDGFPHNAIRGFLGTMAKLVDSWQTANIVCAWDVDWRPQWRVDLLPSYKTHRLLDEATVEEEETPETLGPQVDGLAAILDAMGIARPGSPAHEADDVLATLATSLEDDVVVVSGDRDLVQLVDDRVRLLLTVNGGMDKWPAMTPSDVMDRFGVRPDQYVDLAVLRGDPSDGIPGIPGIGAKTAASLLTEFGSLENIIQAAQDPRPPLSAKRAQAILDGVDYLRAACTVATVVRHAPIEWPAGADADTLARLGAEWGVQRQIEQLQASLARFA